MLTTESVCALPALAAPFIADELPPAPPVATECDSVLAEALELLLLVSGPTVVAPTLTPPLLAELTALEAEPELLFEELVSGPTVTPPLLADDPPFTTPEIDPEFAPELDPLVAVCCAAAPPP